MDVDRAARLSLPLPVRSWLQWSHVLMDVDSSGPILAYFDSYVLQWSHVLMDVDRGRRRPSLRLWACASMEPRPDGRG